MTEAWQAREAGQRQLVEELARLIDDACDEVEPYEKFVASVMIIILGELQKEMGVAGGLFLQGSDAVMPWQLFWDTIAPRIQAFIRIPEERRFLLFRLFEKLADSIGSWASHEYRMKAMLDPRAVYGATSAMAKVEDD